MTPETEEKLRRRADEIASRAPLVNDVSDELLQQLLHDSRPGTISWIRRDDYAERWRMRHRGQWYAAHKPKKVRK